MGGVKSSNANVCQEACFEWADLRERFGGQFLVNLGKISSKDPYTGVMDYAGSDFTANQPYSLSVVIHRLERRAPSRYAGYGGREEHSRFRPASEVGLRRAKVEREEGDSLTSFGIGIGIGIAIEIDERMIRTKTQRHKDDN